MRFKSSMMSGFRKEGPPLLRVRRVLAAPLAPLAVCGAFFAPIAVLSFPIVLVQQEDEWVRLVGVISAILISTLCVFAAWAIASDVRQGWRKEEIDLDTVAYMCGLGMTPAVIGFACYAAGIGAAG